MATYRSVVDRAEHRLQKWLADLSDSLGAVFQTLAGIVFALLGIGIVLLVCLAIVLWAWRIVF